MMDSDPLEAGLKAIEAAQEAEETETIASKAELFLREAIDRLRPRGLGDPTPWDRMEQRIREAPKGMRERAMLILMEALVQRAETMSRADRQQELIRASRQGMSLAIEALARVGVDLNHREPMGITAPMRAAFAGKIRALETLERLGADLTAKDALGRDAIEWARQGQSSLGWERSAIGRWVADKEAGIRARQQARELDAVVESSRARPGRTASQKRPAIRL